MLSREERFAANLIVAGLIITITALALLLSLTQPNPQSHCKAQQTLSTDACYLELTK